MHTVCYGIKNNMCTMDKRISEELQVMQTFLNKILYGTNRPKGRRNQNNYIQPIYTENTLSILINCPGVK